MRTNFYIFKPIYSEFTFTMIIYLKVLINFVFGTIWLIWANIAEDKKSSITMHSFIRYNFYNIHTYYTIIVLYDRYDIYEYEIYSAELYG